MFTYYPQGVCSSKYEFEIEDGVIQSVTIYNGCHGNLQGLSSLLRGMPVDEAVRRLEGIQCRGGTSCPDQISRALRKYQAQQETGKAAGE